jgi:hypothetical protein
METENLRNRDVDENIILRWSERNRKRGLRK